MPGKPPSPDMLVGSRHPTAKSGVLEVTAYHIRGGVDIRFVDTGTVRLGVAAASIRAGAVYDPMARTVHGKGYMGLGYFTRATHVPAYGRWAGMIGRVHAPRTEQMRQEYSDCIIVDDWYNFQLFAQWFYDQPLNDKPSHELDKDLKVLGNRVYGPDTCTLIPKELNSLISRDQRKNSYGSGVGIQSTGRFYAHIRTRGIRTHLGSFDTAEEAAAAYQVAHFSRIVSTAQRLRRENLLTFDQLELVISHYGKQS